MKTRTRGMKLGLGALGCGVWLAAHATAPVINHILMIGATPQFSIQSDLGITNQIQFSTNLGQANWTVLTNIVVAQSPYLFVDASAPPVPSRFYRVAALSQTNNPPPSGMVPIPAGSFTMGDAFSEGFGDDLPLHLVYVSLFYLDRYEVPKGLWDEVYNWGIANGYSFDNPGSGKAATHPVQTVSWYDCVKWCNARSEKEGRVPAYYTNAAHTAVYRGGQTDVGNDWVNWSAGYQLPTEAQWEKAARGGAAGRRFSWADTDEITHSRANYYSTTEYTYDTSPTRGNQPTFAVGNFPYTSPAGYFAPNDYGLYDMVGNVSEWCWDWYDESAYSSGSPTDPRGPAVGLRRVDRGGRWDRNAYLCRTAYRDHYSPTFGDNVMGFRCALPPDQNSSPTNMVLIPVGNFTMGDTFGEGASDERPLHTNEVSAFYIEAFAVTKALWDEVHNWATNHAYRFDNPGSGKAVTHPVQAVSWYDCVKWCNARSEKEGRVPAYYTNAAHTAVYRDGQTDVENDWVNWSTGYQLPTEAQWEKAARGGLGGQRFTWGNTISWSQANYYAFPGAAGGSTYDVNSTSGYLPAFAVGGYPYTSPVGFFAPNSAGLYDLVGNVWGWCWDWYGAYSSDSQTDPRGPVAGSYRVARGGSWSDLAESCRSAARLNLLPTYPDGSVGFRVVLPVP